MQRRSVLGAAVTAACALAGGATSAAPAPKPLVIYFSRAGENYRVGVVKEGNTAILARSIAKALSADLFEIRPVKPYPAGYEDTKTIASEELRKGLLPAFEGKPARLKEAGVVYVGCPVWWGAPPQIVLSFLKQCPELDGKTLVPFGTHGGSGMGSLEALLRRLFPASTVRRALSVPGTAVQEPGLEQTVRDWLKAQ